MRRVPGASSISSPRSAGVPMYTPSTKICSDSFGSTSSRSAPIGGGGLVTAPASPIAVGTARPTILRRRSESTPKSSRRSAARRPLTARSIAIGDGCRRWQLPWRRCSARCCWSAVDRATRARRCRLPSPGIRFSHAACCCALPPRRRLAFPPRQGSGAYGGFAAGRCPSDRCPSDLRSSDRRSPERSLVPRVALLDWCRIRPAARRCCALAVSGNARTMATRQMYRTALPTILVSSGWHR